MTRAELQEELDVLSKRHVEALKIFVDSWGPTVDRMDWYYSALELMDETKKKTGVQMDALVALLTIDKTDPSPKYNYDDELKEMELMDA